MDGCVVLHAVIPRKYKMCEDCGSKAASFGTPTVRTKRWCAGCGKAHNAIRLTRQKMCEDCGNTRACYGTCAPVFAADPAMTSFVSHV